METGTVIADQTLEYQWWYGPDDVNEADERHMDEDADIFRAVNIGRRPSSVRCYTWSRPAVTIGCLQDEESARAAFPGLPLYRRPTGGRGVRHGDDLTITVAASHAVLGVIDGRGVAVMQAYLYLVAPVRESLAKFGFETEIGDKTRQQSRTIARDDCFTTVAPCDVLDAKYGIKVLGCALRRSTSSVLLQMSLRPLAEVNIFGREFLYELRRQYERCMNIGL